MAPADLLQPLEGQREETLRVIDSLTAADLAIGVRGDDWSVHDVLCHLVDREIGIDVLIGRALAGEVVHASQEERAQVGHAEVGAESAGWDLERIREELVAARERLRQTFLRMQEEDLDLPIRWQEWPARTIRTTIPYLLEHEDSHMDELRDAVEREHRLVP